MPDNITAIEQKEIQPNDPNVLQNRASNPETSAWVSASAGSGKTKVLTDRMLRLLLPQKNGKPGAPPHKILALTFTKAGAKEMSLRIHKTLSEWAVMPLDGKDGLYENLDKLLGHNPTDLQLESAQKLFATVVDTAGGLKIMTIHSFCQSILGRFPLEANLTPGFQALEEYQAEILLKKAQNKIFDIAREEATSPLSDAIHNLILSQNEDQFSNLIENIISEKKQFQNILKKNFGTDGLYTAICKKLDIPAGKTQEEIIYHACLDNAFDKDGLWECCKALSEGSKTDTARSDTIQYWLELSDKERLLDFDKYQKAFITTENTIFKKLATVKIQNNFPDAVTVLQTEAERIFDLIQKLKAIHISTLTRDLFIIGEAILNEYQNLKDNIGALDFDDLILRTLNLLQGNTPKMSGLHVTPWIRYKLDQGIDHILVDEAQDTNPEQWSIIKALSDDFFSDMSDDDDKRTIFVVGDEKQSIFSFQRASPEKFQEMRDWFEDKITSHEKNFEAIDFNMSFRSVQSVLELVDYVFETPDMSQGLSRHKISHSAYRYTQAGLVELWPLFQNSKKEEYNPWTPPIHVKDSSSGAAKTATFIAEKIENWISKKEILDSYNRPIEAGDIMILVRSRTAFLDQVVRALKIRNIPVSGIDRMILNQQLVVQDLFAAAAFCLLPNDDLTLATILKSPFLGLSEEDLFTLCHDRKGKTLWSVVKKEAPDDIVSWLENLIVTGGKTKPYEFFSGILQNPCPTQTSGLKAIKARLGDESLDPLDEFLNSTIAFEKDNIATLQNFIASQSQQEHQIKREMENAHNAVRIMTVHGAKGLQAPIVILPDTVISAGSAKPDRILWPHKTRLDLPFFCPSKKDLPPICEEAMRHIEDKNDEEYRRLLYVALTRAEERLYITGYEGDKKRLDKSWYNYIQTGFEKLDNIKTIEENSHEILRHTNPATDTADNADKTNKKITQTPEEAPAWLFKNIEKPSFPPRPLTPSRPSESEMPALSPLKADEDFRFIRGNITHKLLEILPDTPKDNWQENAEKFVALPAHNLSKKIQKSIVSETLAVLNNSEFGAIFGPGSIAEVPVTGLLDNKRLVSGQIDRLLVTKDTVFIIDFKTNRPPPTEEKDVPLIYKNQLKAYADIMRQIYPDKKIQAALLWTDGPSLMIIKNL